MQGHSILSMTASVMEEGVSRQQASNYSRKKTFLPAVDAVVFPFFAADRSCRMPFQITYSRIIARVPAMLPEPHVTGKFTSAFSKLHGYSCHDKSEQPYQHINAWNGHRLPDDERTHFYSKGPPVLQLCK